MAFKKPRLIKMNQIFPKSIPCIAKFTKTPPGSIEILNIDILVQKKTQSGKKLRRPLGSLLGTSRAPPGAILHRLGTVSGFRGVPGGPRGGGRWLEDIPSGVLVKPPLGTSSVTIPGGKPHFAQVANSGAVRKWGLLRGKVSQRSPSPFKAWRYGLKGEL